MSDLSAVVRDPTALSPLPPILQRGLLAVSIFGFLSFASTLALSLHLLYKVLFRRSQRQSETRTNQFLLLITNLIIADLQQSIAFLLNSHWLALDAIIPQTPACFAQGWFVSTGDLASGVFTFAIAVHCFADIVFDARLPHKLFLATIAALWAFVYVCAGIGIALHPGNFYVRAGAWCWISLAYKTERLWLHYFWILLAEFGTVIIYSLTFLVLRKRVKESFYATTETQLRAQSAAKMILAYPIVYIVCTLPLVTARLESMAGQDVSFVELCIAGAMITSNGWLDVLLYTVTRRGVIFGPTVPDDGVTVLDTFRLRPDQDYGTTTTVEASRRLARTGSSRDGSTEELVYGRLNGAGRGVIKADTTVVVRSEVLELNPIRVTGSEPDLQGKMSLDQRSGKSDR